MPGGDRTGPLGYGAMSGRGTGFCGGPGNINGFRRGFGGDRFSTVDDAHIMDDEKSPPPKPLAYRLGRATGSIIAFAGFVNRVILVFRSGRRVNEPCGGSGMGSGMGRGMGSGMSSDMGSGIYGGRGEGRGQRHRRKRK